MKIGVNTEVYIPIESVRIKYNRYENAHAEVEHQTCYLENSWFHNAF